MEFIKIEKGGNGRFIHRFDLTYRTEDGNEKVYEIISRKKNVSGLDELHNDKLDAVILIMYDDEGRILLNREYRLSIGEWVYNFPAGLIDPGETPEEAASRELWEETGLHLERIEDILAKSYSAVGFSDEKTVCVIGKASGMFRKSTSAEEEIEPCWVSKDEMRTMLTREPFASRTQAWCYMWCHDGTF